MKINICSNNIISRVVIIMFLLSSVALLGQTPDSKTFFYNAARDGIKGVSSKPSPGGDLMPTCKKVTYNNMEWIEVSYQGSTGKGRTWIRPQKSFSPDTNRQFIGIKLVIYYAGSDFAKFLVKMWPDKIRVLKQLTLDQGIHEYLITSDTVPSAGWEKLSLVRMDMSPATNGKHPRFLLKSISLIEKSGSAKKKSKIKILQVDRIRKVHEVLPLSDSIMTDGKLNEKTWQSAYRLSDYSYYKSKKLTTAGQSPLSIKFAHDGKKLYIGVQAEFPTSPIAKVIRHDGHVWNDEALEIFFRTVNKKLSHIQYIVNRNGVVFDRKFDTAQKSIDRVKGTAWSLNCKSGFKEGHGVWSSEFSIPFDKIGYTRGVGGFLDFQVSQSYSPKRLDKKHSTLSWTQTQKFTDIKSMGLLVFNKKPFGAGKVTLDKINKSTDQFGFNCMLSDFTPGKYTVKITVVTPDCTLIEEQQKLTIISKKPLRKIFKLRTVNNLNGQYTVYISLLNSTGDARVLAANFHNKISLPPRFGQRLFSPVPKKIVWGKGVFMAEDAKQLYLDTAATARTKKTAQMFADNYFGYIGRRLTLKASKDFNNKSSIVLKLADQTFYNKNKLKQKKEGYHLEVSKDRVVITGFDEPGLYYGTVTFLQLIKSGMKIEKGRPIPVVKINDWPGVHKRMLSLWPPHPISKHNKFKEMPTLAHLKDWVERCVAENKYNFFTLNLGAVIQYKRRMEFNEGKPYTLDDMRALSEFCKDRFIEFIPAWNIGSHSLHWLFGSHPELRETGFKQQADVTHPDHDKIVYDCLLDVIEAVRPKYLSPWTDEWWAKLPNDRSEVRAKLLRGKDRRTVFFEHHLKLYKWLKARGIRMMLYHDMFTPYHNGKRYDIFKLTHTLPKDIIFMPWSPNRKPGYFKDMGFEVWNILNNALPQPQYKKIFSGYGKLAYGFGYAFAVYPKKLGHFLYATPMSSARAADIAWNLQVDNEETEVEQIRSGRASAIASIQAVKKNPYASHKIRPILFKKQMNAGFNQFLKSQGDVRYKNVTKPFSIKKGIVDIGHIPMAMESSSGNNCVIVRKGSKAIEIPVNMNFSSLIFLHALYIKNKGKDISFKNNSHRQWPFGRPAGHYIVNYVDGKSETVRIRIGNNINPLDSDPLMKFAYHSRYIYPILDYQGDESFTYQVVWVNPRPKVKIKSVTLAHDNHLDLATILFALSGREVK